ILENPRDELSWHRVLQLLEGIGPASARRIVSSLQGESAVLEDAPPASPDPSPRAAEDPLQRLLREPPPVPESAREEFAALREALADCARPEVPVAAQIERIRRFYEPVFHRIYDNAETRLRDLDSLEQVASGSPSRAQF